MSGFCQERRVESFIGSCLYGESSQVDTNQFNSATWDLKHEHLQRFAWPICFWDAKCVGGKQKFFNFQEILVTSDGLVLCLARSLLQMTCGVKLQEELQVPPAQSDYG